MKTTYFDQLKQGQQFRIPEPKTEIEDWESIIYNSTWMRVLIVLDGNLIGTRGGVLDTTMGYVYDLSIKRGSEPSNVWQQFLAKHRKSGILVEIIPDP